MDDDEKEVLYDLPLENDAIDYYIEMGENDKLLNKFSKIYYNVYIGNLDYVLFFLVFNVVLSLMFFNNNMDGVGVLMLLSIPLYSPRFLPKLYNITRFLRRKELLTYRDLLSYYIFGSYIYYYKNKDILDHFQDAEEQLKKKNGKEITKQDKIDIIDIFNKKREGNYTIDKFIRKNVSNNQQYFEENITDVLYTEYIENEPKEDILAQVPISPNIIENISDTYIQKMCRQLNHAYKYGNKNTALILSRHIIETYIQTILEIDEDVKHFNLLGETRATNIEEKLTTGSEGSSTPTLSVLKEALMYKFPIEYKGYTNVTKNENTLNEKLLNIKKSADKGIHSKVNFEDQYNDQEFKDNIEFIVRVLTDIENGVEAKSEN